MCNVYRLAKSLDTASTRVHTHTQTQAYTVCNTKRVQTQAAFKQE